MPEGKLTYCTSCNDPPCNELRANSESPLKWTQLPSRSIEFSTHFNGFYLLALNSFKGGLLRMVQDLS
jgi:hypothetical protein